MAVHKKLLVQVANQAGISERYTNNWGDMTHVPEATLYFLLNELDYDTSSDEALLLSAEKKHKQAILEPVVFIQEGQPIDVALYLGVSARDSDFEWHLETEQGQQYSGYLQSQIVRDERADGGPLVFRVAQHLPLGYHTLSVNRKRRQSPYMTTIIVTPSVCYQQPELAQGKKLWGPSVQLYTLRSEHNWGIGDFGDLKLLVTEMACRGANFVGLNPIHALFPANPEEASPYSPSSRRWLNILYIDVMAIPEFALSSDAQALVGSDDFQAQLQQARETHWVNYSLVTALKMAVLLLLYQEFKRRHLDADTEQARAYHTFVEQGGASLLAQATFDALHQQFHDENPEVWGWPLFPDAYRQFQSPAVQAFIREHVDQVNFYLYLQWLADNQIEEVQMLAKEKGMVIGLYRDLAVGVAPSGSDVWADQGNLMLNVSIGAPPDALGPLGQNWGLPPINPQKLRESGYLPFIRLLHANMKHCGALRIDHILGLLRLWWVPRGESASEGAYLYYPVDELMSILALESHRHHCSVIGEDLGTVPLEMAQLLAKAGIYSYKVFFFETAEDGGYLSPEHYVAQSMSALCTHDMPTLRGFWHCDDLKIGGEIGLYPDQAQLKHLFDNRLRCKQAILDSIEWHGFLPEGVRNDAIHTPMDSALSEGLHLHLASGSSALMSVQLEDWLEMDKPVNIPGTVDEYPNWRRKLSQPLEEMFLRENINRLAAKVTEAREIKRD